MREEGDQERALHQAESEIAAKRAQVIAQRNALTKWNSVCKRRQQWRQHDRQKDIRGPNLGGRDRQEQSDQHVEKCGRRGERAAQIVEQLPASHQRNCGSPHSIAIVETKTEDPGQQLPVAPHPAMLARHRHVITRRKLFNQFYVRRQAARAKTPSSKSWLRIEFSGTCPSSAASKLSIS